MHRFLALVLALCGVGLLHAQQEAPKDLLIIFKDGFHFKAKVRQDKDFIIDPVSKQPIEIASYKGFLFFEDPVRKIYFSPAHIAKPIVLKQGEMTIPNMIRIERNGFGKRAYAILPGYRFEGGPTDWNNNWERVFKMVTNVGGRVDLVQRLVYLDPLYARAEAKDYNWDATFATSEFDVETLRKLLMGYLNSKKDFREYKNWQKRLYIAHFMVQSRHLDAAAKELELILVEAPEQKQTIEPFQNQLKQVKAEQAADDIERGHRVGQHESVQSRLEYFFKDGSDALVSQKQRSTLQDLRVHYEDQTEKIKQTRKALKDLAPHLASAERETWTGALIAIESEIDFANIDRLETFVSFAKPHLQMLVDGKTPEQSTEKIAALAVTGWLLGNGSAEPDPDGAVKLWQARKAVLDIMTCPTAVERGQKIQAYQKDSTVAIDLLARLVKLLPPVNPIDKPGTEARKMTIELADSRGGSYQLMLPPDYNPQRTYPVLMVLHGSSEGVDEFLPRFAEYAHKQGYILAAPVWGQGMKATYNFSEQEHLLVLDTLRDLRRRCLVDSDRVFLFGFEQGATMAWDVGLSHPDQFAGVIPMGGSPKGYAEKYATNGQYLPFYVVDGDQNGVTPKITKAIFKEWVRGHYPSLYMEYKGRGFDWFGGEFANIFDWMDRKKRTQPTKTLGKVEHEFKTTRSCDNRFYWLSTDQILPKNLTDGVTLPTPARLTAAASVGNQADPKTGAKIWTQFNITAFGVRQVSLWLEPRVVDFTKPLAVYVNGSRVHPPTLVSPSAGVLLDDFYFQGDRQRLYYARLDFKW